MKTVITCTARWRAFRSAGEDGNYVYSEAESIQIIRQSRVQRGGERSDQPVKTVIRSAGEDGNHVYSEVESVQIRR